MNKTSLALRLKENFLPGAAGAAASQPIPAVQRVQQITARALSALEPACGQADVWGYCSAFNPLAFVETVMPPDFHSLLQFPGALVDPIRSYLLRKPIIFDLEDEEDQLYILAAYGHPSRWLFCSRDLQQFAWIPDQTPTFSVSRVFQDHGATQKGLVQVRADHKAICTLAPSDAAEILGETLIERLPIAGCKEASLHYFDGQHWSLLRQSTLPSPVAYYDHRLNSLGRKGTIYRLPNRDYAFHLLSSALGVPQANTLLRSLTADMSLNETRRQCIEGCFELYVTSSPYLDGDIAFHVREIVSDPRMMLPLYIDAAKPAQSKGSAGQNRQYAPRRRGRSQSRSK